MKLSIGKVGSDASQVCRCGSSNEPSHSWASDSSDPPDESTFPEMSRSDSGFAPCNICEDPSTAPYHFFSWPLHMSYQPTSPCYCKAGFKSPDGFSPCTPCSPGSNTLSCNDDGWWKIYQHNTGATSCTCSGGFFSSSGTDSEGPCQKCPAGATTYISPQGWYSGGVCVGGGKHSPQN